MRLETSRKAILVGAIGTVVETPEMQRAAFNAAFAEAGLSWHWDQHTYRRLLRSAGGRKRIADYAAAQGEPVDAQALHARKSDLFLDQLRTAAPLRPQVAEVLALAQSTQMRSALVTSTERATAQHVAAMVTRATSHRFDVVTWRGDAEQPKPSPDVYDAALKQLGLAPDQALAIEDNRDGIAAAQAAGLHTLAYPGENTVLADIQAADRVTDGDLARAVHEALYASAEVAQ